MTVRVGIIGVGMIGQEHIRRLTKVVTGSAVVALTDVDLDRAKTVASGIDGAVALPTGQDVVNHPDVDAVVVTSWGPTHEEYVLAAIAAGKPVFCEKPLATTQDACLRIVDAEVAFGRRLVQVGFMRRYDTAYRALKATLDEGAVGDALLFHGAHRIGTVAPNFTDEMMINDAAIHELDIVRWLFDDEIVGVRVLSGRRNPNSPEGLSDPLLVILESESGVLSTVEVLASGLYGYDIRGEIVGTHGTVALAESSSTVVKSANLRSTTVPHDWRDRFLAAYDVEFQEWVDHVARGAEPNGPTSWDGYAATTVADAAIAAMTSGERVGVSLAEKPALYTH